MYYVLLFFFFFQAEDGIRDVAVTGVQTCALPIYLCEPRPFGWHSLPSAGCVSGNRTAVRSGAGKSPDRKSTRLNSSHGYISYAVFCLKKKKKQREAPTRVQTSIPDLCELPCATTG